MPRAYSYVRFSTPAQSEGDSERRQIALAEAACRQHGWQLDQSLRFYDAGISAFRGRNGEDGALAAFLQAVRSGRVERGSVLVVENLDRLSRMPPRHALHVLEEILDAGIDVHTPSDGRTYTADHLDDDLAALLVILLTFSRGNQESQMKSLRNGEDWRNRRKKAAENGAALRARCPAWLRYNPETERYEPIPERAKLVRRIFELTKAGHGAAYIARLFNQEGIDSWGQGKQRADGWHKSYIRKILRNPAVIGHLQPMKVLFEGNGKRKKRIGRVADGPLLKNQFPAVVAETDYYRLQRAGRPEQVSDRKGRPLANWLRGLCFCSACKGAMHLVNKGKPPKGGEYLYCDAMRRKRTCNAPAARYHNAFFAVCAHLQRHAEWLDLDLADTGQRDLAGEIAQLRAAIADKEQQVERLVDVLSRNPASRAIEQRLERLEAAIAEEQKQLAALEIEHRAAGGADRRQELEDAASVCVAATTTHTNCYHCGEYVRLDTRTCPSCEQPIEGARKLLSEADRAVMFNTNLRRLLSRIEVDRSGVSLFPHGAAEPHRVEFEELSQWA